MDAEDRATQGAVAEEVQGWAISETRMTYMDVLMSREDRSP